MVSVLLPPPSFRSPEWFFALAFGFGGEGVLLCDGRVERKQTGPPLAHLVRAPKADRRRPAAFVRFAASSLTFSASVAPGAVAPAFRFVNSLIGQQTDLARLAAVLVS